MDKHNIIQAHSKEKLSIYQEYLKGYLSILTNQPHFKIINIIDLFAGRGVSENGKDGSAVIAAKLIKDFRERSVTEKKNVQFFLNEKSPENYQQLKKTLSEYNFPKITNKSADDFVTVLFESGCLSPINTRGSRSLLFIDPYGYTQLSQENLNRLLKPKEVEILLFVPTNSIYRFKNKEGNPARKFILDFGIAEPILNNIRDIDSFSEELGKILKDKAETAFVYRYKIRNKNANSLFHLFFVTKHIKGAEKFLEAKSKIKESLKRQLTFFDEEEPKRTNRLKSILSQEITNKDLYSEIIKSGYLAREIIPILKEMESTGCLEIRADFKRRKNAYYLEEKPNKIIFLRIKP